MSGESGFDKRVWKYLKHVIIYLCVGLFMIFLFIAVAVMFLPETKGQLLISYVDAAGSVIGATLGSILAFVSIVFVVYSLRYQTNEKKRDEQELDKNRLIYFYALLCQSIKFLEAVIEGLKKRSKAFEQDKFRFHGFSIGVVNSLYRISNEINQEHYYLAYKKAFVDDTISVTFSTIDAVQTSHNEMLKYAKEKQEFHQERLSNLASYVTVLKNILDRQRKDFDPNHLSFNSYDPAESMYQNYLTDIRFLSEKLNELLTVKDGESLDFEKIVNEFALPYGKLTENHYDDYISHQAHMDDVITYVGKVNTLKTSIIRNNEIELKNIKNRDVVENEKYLKFLANFMQNFERDFFAKYAEVLSMKYTPFNVKETD
jgi:hypothetical protein